MEQDTTGVAPVVDGSDKKSGNGLKIATVIASVIAVCGIGFGIYGMVQSSQKDSQISDLKVQIKGDDGTITTIEKPEIETNSNNETTVTIVDSAIKNEDTKDYIYIGEWGIKIKISDELTNINYQYVGDGYHDSCRTLELTASTKGDGSKPSFIKTVLDERSSLGAVMRCPKEDFYPYGTSIDIDDPVYSYYYEGPQLSFTQTDWESESVNAIKDMFMDPANYSAI